MKKFVVFDEDGGWAAQIEAESLESVLLFVCEDREKDFYWSNGDSLKVGEIVFDGTVCSSAVPNKFAPKPVEQTSEDFDWTEIYEGPLFPIGTVLEAQVDFPVSIRGMHKGDVGIVESDYRIQLLQGKYAGKTYWYGDKKNSMETFNESWKIIYTPPLNK